MPKYSEGLQELRRSLDHADRTAPEVSGWSVGMHIHHCELVMIGICRSMARSTLPPPRTGFNLLRSIVLLTGRIPRGRAQSPEEAVPTPDVPGTDLEKALDLAERMMDKTRKRKPDVWYRHFAFGVLRRDAALRVLEIHNRHHLRIIRDILSA